MQKEIRNGILGAISLLLFYFIIMTIASRSWSATISQFQQLWYWMIMLSTGFGIQIGLFTHLQTVIKHHQMTGNPKAVTAASTGTSAVSMIACCAHHLSDVLPIIGLSGLAVFLTQYQIPLIILGVVMNGFGIVYMVKQIYKIKNKRVTFRFFPSLSRTNKVLAIICAIVILEVVYAISKPIKTEMSSTVQSQPSTSNKEANVSIEVTPKVLETGKNPEFQIAFNTHSVDLSFDVTKVVVLTDEAGNKYTDSTWNGAGPGGHHRDGTITFNQPLINTKSVELIIKDVAGVPERKFKWNI